MILKISFIHSNPSLSTSSYHRSISLMYKAIWNLAKLPTFYRLWARLLIGDIPFPPALNSSNDEEYLNPLFPQLRWTKNTSLSLHIYFKSSRRSYIYICFRLINDKWLCQDIRILSFYQRWYLINLHDSELKNIYHIPINSVLYYMKKIRRVAFIN